MPALHTSAWGGGRGRVRRWKEGQDRERGEEGGEGERRRGQEGDEWEGRKGGRGGRRAWEGALGEGGKGRVKGQMRAKREREIQKHQVGRLDHVIRQRYQVGRLDHVIRQRYQVATTEPWNCRGRPYWSHTPPLQVPSCEGKEVVIRVLPGRGDPFISLTNMGSLYRCPYHSGLSFLWLIHQSQLGFERIHTPKSARV